MENTQKSFIRQPGRKAEDSIRRLMLNFYSLLLLYKLEDGLLLIR